MYRYATFPMTNIEGIKKAERYKANGWETIRCGLFTIQMRKPLPAKRGAK